VALFLVRWHRDAIMQGGEYPVGVGAEPVAERFQALPGPAPERQPVLDRGRQLDRAEGGDVLLVDPAPFAPGLDDADL
jgi:hypothetical protein